MKLLVKNFSKKAIDKVDSCGTLAFNKDVLKARVPEKKDSRVIFFQSLNKRAKKLSGNNDICFLRAFCLYKAFSGKIQEKQ